MATSAADFFGTEMFSSNPASLSGEGGLPPKQGDIPVETCPPGQRWDAAREKCVNDYSTPAPGGCGPRPDRTCPTGSHLECRTGEWMCVSDTLNQPTPTPPPPPTLPPPPSTDVPCDPATKPTCQEGYEAVCLKTLPVTWACIRIGGGGGGGGDCDPAAKPDCGGGSYASCIQTDPPQWGCFPITGGGGSDDESMAGIPQDVRGLRATLTRILQTGLLNTAPGVPGGVSVPLDPAFAQSISTVLQHLEGSMKTLRAASNTANRLQNFQGPGFEGLSVAQKTAAQLQTTQSPEFEGLDTAQQTAERLQEPDAALNPFMSTYEELARTGGAPDITRALAAIRSKGMLDIEQLNATNREKYGEMGLGAGTDVSEAVARGSSMGISDILSRQETLIANILSAANATRLSAAQGGTTALEASRATQLSAAQLGGTLSQVRPTYELGTNQLRLQAAQLGGTLAQVEPTYALESAKLQLGAAGLLPQIAEIEATAGMNAGSLLASVAGARQGVATGNMERGIAEFLRTSQPQYMNEALSLATGYPPMQQTPVVQSSGGWSDLLTMLPMLLTMLPRSSRTLKDVGEVVSSQDILTKLEELVLFRWKYKGEDVVHLGPMAEDFQRLFGVGDGKTLHPVDVFGVLLAAAKALVEKVNA